MVVGVVESFKLSTFDLGRDIEKCGEQVGDNLVTVQAPRGGPTNKGYLSTPPSQNNSNKCMQPSLGLDREEQPLEE